MDIGKRYDRVKVRYLPVWLSVCAILVILFAVDSSHLGVARTIDRYEKMRRKMIQAIEDDVRETSQRIGKKQLDPRVMEVIGTVPRHEFVPLNRSMFAYENRPLPIGFGQTISQPYIVALMTDLLNVKSDAVILEIGTGSGYQAAILSALVKAVYTIEIIKPLGNTARTRLEKLGYTNVQVRLGDGYFGWPEHALFDGIIVTAAVGHIPPPLIQQLKPGGRMVIPVGSPFLIQHLTLVEKDHEGGIKTRQVLPVRFVPLTGKH